MASTPTWDLQEEFLAATRKSQETVVPRDQDLG